MKTTSIFQKTLVIIAMFVFIGFAFNACSSDDDGPDPPIPIPGPTSFVLSAGDFPSVTIASEGAAVLIGDPILSATKKHVGNFSPDITKMRAQNWRSKIRRETHDFWGNVDYEYVPKDFGTTNQFWCDSLPKEDYYFWNSTNRELLNYDVIMPSKFKKRFALMEDSNWKTTDFSTSEYRDVGWAHSILVELRFKQIIPDPEFELYISMERNYIIENPSSNNVTRTEGLHTIGYECTTGSEKTELTTMGASLSVDVSASYLALSASLNATIYGESSNAISVSESEVVYGSSIHTIPPGERWKFITLTEVETYYFSYSNGEPWGSDNLEFNSLGTITSSVGTNNIVIKYKDGEIISFYNINDGIETLQ